MGNCANKSFSRLKMLVIDHPEILEVISNIRLNKELDYSVKIESQSTLQMYIEELFVPMLLKYEYIVKDSSKTSGYRLGSHDNLRFIEGYTNTELINIGTNSLKNLAIGINECQKEEFLVDVMTCRMTREEGLSYIKTMRDQARNKFKNRNLKTSGTQLLKHVIVVRLY